MIDFCMKMSYNNIEVGEKTMDNSVYSGFKCGRVLQLYSKLINGDVINKAEEAKRFEVHARSIQRDIDELRAFFENQAADGYTDKFLVYDNELKGYYLQAKDELSLANSEVFAVCKILLESRAFRKDEITPIIEKLLNGCVPKKKQAIIKDLIANELYHYVQPQHNKAFISSMWSIGSAVKEHRLMNITYIKQDGSEVKRLIKPVGIMFSEFYFYLTAFIDGIDKKSEFDNPDDIFPTIYRIDRIQSFEVLDKHFDIPYKDRFEEGEFRKRIQFMYGGKLRRIKFLYKGLSAEAVLDRLPTAKIIEKNDEGYIISAEVFGDGVDMWMRSHGNLIEVIQ